MTDIAYDPELPYAVVQIRSDDPTNFPLGVIARLRDRDDAINMEDVYAPGYVEVIDTTPKPKIPADAEYIAWSPTFFRMDMAFRDEGNPSKPWAYDGIRYSEESLLEEIGDAEVTVLEVRK